MKSELKTCLVGALFFACAGDPGPAVATPVGAGKNGQYVVLLHGMGRTAFSMIKLEWALSREGYRVINVSYPSTCSSIESLADDWLARLLRDRISDPTAKVHFVTHSLGGIVVRQYLANHTMKNLGRVVMLAPPNQGNQMVEKCRGNHLYRMFTGPAGQQLGTGRASVPRSLPPASYEAGVISGDRSANLLFSLCIPGPDDGKVSVESTRLQGMRDFLRVHHSHTWLMCHKDVIGAVARFLAVGRFGSDGEPGESSGRVGKRAGDSA